MINTEKERSSGVDKNPFRRLSEIEVRYRNLEINRKASILLRGYDDGNAPEKRIEKLLRGAIRGNARTKELLFMLVEGNDEIVDLVNSRMPESYLYMPGTEKIMSVGYLHLTDIVQNRLKEIFERQEEEMIAEAYLRA